MNPLNNPLTIRQSIGITFQVIGLLILAGPIMLLDKLIGKEATFFLYYCVAMTASYWIVSVFVKSRGLRISHRLELQNFDITVFVLIATVCIPIGISAPIFSLIPVPDTWRRIFLEMANQNGIFSFLAIVIAAPVMEELIFRGVVLEGLLRRYSPSRSIIVSALLFGFVHLNPWQFVSASFIGLFMGWIYYRTRSVAMTIIIHMFNNLAAFLISTSTEVTIESFEETMIESYGGLLPFLIVTTSAVAILVGCIYYLHSRLDYYEPDDDDVVVSTAPSSDAMEVVDKQS
jgi:uncharacterized protein